MTDAVRAALAELVACHTESAGWSMSMMSNRAEFDAMIDRSQKRLEAAVAAARAALSEQPAHPAPVERSWIGSIPAEESDAEFAAQIARMDAKTAPVERVTLSDKQIDTIEAGDYIEAVLSAEDLRTFARAVIAEYERANGVEGA